MLLLLHLHKLDLLYTLDVGLQSWRLVWGGHAHSRTGSQSRLVPVVQLLMLLMPFLASEDASCLRHLMSALDSESSE